MYSASSEALERLLTWSNPVASQANPKIWTRTGKFVAAELGGCLLVVAAIIETVTLCIIATISLPFYYSSACKETAMYHVHGGAVGVLPSSFFTIFWAISNVFIFNPCSRKVITNEWDARMWVDDKLGSFPVKFTRQCDRRAKIYGRPKQQLENLKQELENLKQANRQLDAIEEALTSFVDFQRAIIEAVENMLQAADEAPPYEDARAT